MSLKPQFSFSAGELDPVLHDKVTLERFQNSLATARNVIVTKKGSIMTRFGRFHFKKTKYDNNPINCYSPPNSNVVIELGLKPDGTERPYVAIYDFEGTELYYVEASTPEAPTDDRFRITSESLNKLHFVTSKEYVYVFPGTDADSLFFRIKYTPDYGVRVSNQFLTIPSFTTPLTVTFTFNGTGYLVDYAFTMLFNGQESLPAIYASGTMVKKPIQASEQNTMVIHLHPAGSGATAFMNSVNEVRMYERPLGGSAFGFLGRTTNIYMAVDGSIKAKIVDIGANADFGQGLQSLVSKERLSDENIFGNLRVATGTMYQQRLMLGNFINYNKEALLASRPGFQNNFYRDFPYGSDSAFNFKVGTDGNAEILKMVESDGLVVFTRAGVFVSVGVLSVNNLALVKRGDWIIDEDVPPLVIPGGLFFVDKTTNSVRQLLYSQELASFTTSDQSVFSDHLFSFRTITSWAYQEGVLPMIIVTFSDGTFATFTYDYEHQMKAWTRHDSKYPVERVIGTRIADTTIFVINKNGTRHFEMSVPREVPARIYASNTEASLLAYMAFMDNLKVTVNVLNNSLEGNDKLNLVPVTPNDWEGDLTLTCGTSELFAGVLPGKVYRWFWPKGKNRWTMTLKVLSVTNNNTVIVEPSEEFPSTYANDIKLYNTHNVVTGLNHLEGEEVSVIADGGVVSSPYNDNDMGKMTSLVVVGGQITLPDEYNSAITIVGLPIVADLKTLNMSTIEQSPVLLESLTVNKLYARLYESKGVYVGNQFPENEEHEVDGTSVKDMQSVYDIEVKDNVPFIGNKPMNPTSERRELTTPGTYRNQGQIALRQVDPLHYEILSIIADVEILNRGR